MKVRFLALLLLISGIQAISTSEFNMNITSQDQGLIQSNGQTHELFGKLYRSIEDSTRLNNKVEVTKNEYKEELLNIPRKAQGGSSGGAGKRGGKGGGTADVNRRPHQNSSPSLSSNPHFWVSTFNLCVSFILVTLFPLM